MARRPKRPCNHPGCKELVEGRYCEAHEKQQNRERNKYSRVPEHQKLYDYKWQQARAAFLRDNPLCVECKKGGKLEPATDVDHIIPHKGDTGLFWDSDNWQALCKSCHSKKTYKEVMPGQPRQQTKVFLICGPPGSGKTTYVTNRMRWGDIVVDLDWLWQALTGLKYYQKPDGLLPYVLAARDAVVDRLTEPGEATRAWVVSGAPTAKERNTLARRLKAKIVVLEVDEQECLRRIQRDDRRGRNADAWVDAVQRWWRKYERLEGDIVVK